MTRIQKQAALVGIATTIIVTSIALLGVFETWERRTIDLRFTSGRLVDQPMSDSIAHVDIDDGAMDTQGRWPWDRALIADAVDELRKAGARALVLDLLFDESSPTSEDDRRLAEAIAGIPTVLAVHNSADWEFAPEWQTTTGLGERFRLLDVLADDIRIDAKEAVVVAGLTGPRVELFKSREWAFKRVAIWRSLVDRAPSDPVLDSLAAFIAELDPRARTSKAQQKMIADLWNRNESWKALSGSVMGESAIRLSRDLAPIPVLARVAGMVGFVHAERDRGGVVRYISAMEPTPAGQALPLGLAGAMTFAGIDPRAVRVGDDRLFLGDRSLRTRDGRLWLYWPTTESDWVGLLRQSPSDSESHGHLSIGVLIQIADIRRTLASQRLRLQDTAKRLVDGGFIDTPLPAEGELPDAALEEIREGVLFILGPDPKRSDIDQLPVDQQESWRLCLFYNELDDEVRRSALALTSAEARVREVLNDKLVFIGHTATGAIADRHPTPLGVRTPGVVVHAVMADMFLSSRSLQFLPGWSAFVLTVGMGILCTLLAMRYPIMASGLATLVLLAIYLGLMGLVVFQAWSMIVPLVAPMVCGSVAWLTCAAYSGTMFQRDRLRITRQFKARVSGQLVDYLRENPDALSVSGDERDVTVVFCDLADFTSISERLGGPDTVKLLNRYMCRFTELMIEQRGYVNKFLGDGLMAFWSAFAYDADQAELACKAVTGCRDALDKLNALSELSRFPNLSMRAGITTGRVIVGDCGAPPHLNDYTVIGDAVNLAARLESANKQFGTNILIDGGTKAELGDARTRYLGRVGVIGQARPVDLYELPPNDTSPNLIEQTEQAVRAFIAGDLALSRRSWEHLRASHGPSRLIGLYLAAIESSDAPTDGILRLQSK